MPAYGPRIDRATPRDDGFNTEAVLPYSLGLEDFRLAMLDVYDLLHDINQALLNRGGRRLEETTSARIFSGILSDVLPAFLARHSRDLTENQLPNGHPDLLPRNLFPKDGSEGVEVKVTRRDGRTPMKVWEGWLLVFRYRIDSGTEPVINRAPTRFVEVLLARLTSEDFRGEYGTRTANPNRSGMVKLRSNWIYRDPDLA